MGAELWSGNLKGKGPPGRLNVRAK